MYTERIYCAVDSVSEGSPASVAGLVPGDKIIKFGNVSASDGNHLPAVSKHVQVSSTRGDYLQTRVLI